MEPGLDALLDPEAGKLFGAVVRIFPDEGLRARLLAGPYGFELIRFARELDEKSEILRITLADLEGDEPDALGSAYGELRCIAALRASDPSLELAYQQQLNEVRRLEQAEADEFNQAFNARWGRQLEVIEAALAAISGGGRDDEGPSPSHGPAGCRD